MWGLENGYALMIGGEDEPVGRLEPVFRSLAPGIGTRAGRTVGREGDPRPPRRASSTAARPAPATS